MPRTPSAVPSRPTPPPDDQIRFGNAALFRNLIPSATLETQAARGIRANPARSANATSILLGDDNALVKRVRDIINHEIPFALKWNDRSKNWKWEVNVVQVERDPHVLPAGRQDRDL